MKMTVAEHNTAPESAQGADASIDRGVLETLLEDVGPKNAEPVINALSKNWCCRRPSWRRQQRGLIRMLWLARHID